MFRGKYKKYIIFVCNFRKKCCQKRKKETKKTTKNTAEYDLKFRDGCIFIQALLSDLTDNLSE